MIFNVGSLTLNEINTRDDFEENFSSYLDTHPATLLIVPIIPMLYKSCIVENKPCLLIIEYNLF